MERVYEHMQCDPLAVLCRSCGSRAGVPCAWPPVINPADAPPLYHAERETDSDEQKGNSRSQSSPANIHLYHGNASLLVESLEVIQKTTSVILSALAPPLPNEEEQGIAASPLQEAA